MNLGRYESRGKGLALIYRRLEFYRYSPPGKTLAGAIHIECGPLCLSVARDPRDLPEY